MVKSMAGLGGGGGLPPSNLGLNPSFSLAARGSNILWTLVFSFGKWPMQTVPTLAKWDTRKEHNKCERFHIG